MPLWGDDIVLVFSYTIWVCLLALPSSALGPLGGSCPFCKVRATVLMDKVITVAERTQN